ncbi:MAG: hypothetical protein KDD38_10715 [Bdellovibrionales bacterium]|nr:hypothetical protein [Bdellovibrionales bacterium]
MKKYNLLTLSLFSAALIFSSNAIAEETTAEKAQTATNKTVNAVKKTYRNAKGEICEMIDGKANCAVKKVVNKIKNTADSIETTAKEAKNKAD